MNEPTHEMREVRYIRPTGTLIWRAYYDSISPRPVPPEIIVGDFTIEDGPTPSQPPLAGECSCPCRCSDCGCGDTRYGPARCVDCACWPAPPVGPTATGETFPSPSAHEAGECWCGRDHSLSTEQEPTLGRLVREVWVEWAREQPDVAEHPSWLVPWEQLPERDREVDRRIEAAIWESAQAPLLAEIETLKRAAVWANSEAAAAEVIAKERELTDLTHAWGIAVSEREEALAEVTSLREAVKAWFDTREAYKSSRVAHGGVYEGEPEYERAQEALANTYRAATTAAEETK